MPPPETAMRRSVEQYGAPSQNLLQRMSPLLTPKRHFSTIICRIAKASFDHLVGNGARPARRAIQCAGMIGSLGPAALFVADGGRRGVDAYIAVDVVVVVARHHPAGDNNPSGGIARNR